MNDYPDFTVGTLYKAEYYRQDFGYWVHKAKIKVIGNIFFNK